MGSLERSMAVIDVSQFRSAVSDPRTETLLQIKKACEEIGCFQIVNHGLDAHLLQSALSCSEQFFSLPLEEKQKLRTESHPVGFVNESEKDGILDKKEHLLFFCEDHPLNQWPKKPLHSRRVIENVMREAGEVAKLVICAVLESLGLPENTLDTICPDTRHAFILAFYPASPSWDFQDPALGAHQDADILTVLAELNAVEGLEVLVDGEWLRVKVEKDALVITLGDIMQVWSNGRYKSVIHRVAKSGSDRYSLAHFYNPGPKTEIGPLPKLIENEAAKYKPYIQGVHVKARMEDRKLSNNSKTLTIEDYAI